MMTTDNLLPGFDTDQWRPWCQRDKIAPRLEKAVLDNERVLWACANRFEQFGKWLCDITDIKGGDTYRFSVEYRAQNISHETVALHGMMSWRDKDGRIHTRDYINHLPGAGNDWKILGRTIDAPEGAVSLTIELAFKWADSGSVTWRNPILQKVEPVKHRIVKVASAFNDKAGTLEGNLEQILLAIDKAGAEKADIVCLGETPYDLGVDLPLAQRAVTIPGPVTDILSERAKRHSMYIVLSMVENDGGIYYNTGLLIDRHGGIAGKYHKMQLPLCEAEDGVTPGRDYPVFDTDFGRIGILICWDSMFPEVSRILARKGAEILFIPTLMNTDIQAPARAFENGVYVVACEGRWGISQCKIYNPKGEAIASVLGAEYNANGMCTTVIDLDKRFYTYYLSVGPAFGEGKSCYRQEYRCDTFGQFAE